MEDLTNNYEQYKFLEDVPDWDNKLKKFELSRDWQHLTDKYGGYIDHRGTAEIYVKEVEEVYGKASAKVNQTTDPQWKRVAFRVIVDKPLKIEFKDILDINGNILPSRE